MSAEGETVIRELRTIRDSIKDSDGLVHGIKETNEKLDALKLAQSTTTNVVGKTIGKLETIRKQINGEAHKKELQSTSIILQKLNSLEKKSKKDSQIFYRFKYQKFNNLL